MAQKPYLTQQKNVAGEAQAVYVCRLRTGHPTGVYRRGGFTFHPIEPTRIPAEAMTDDIRNDGWIMIEDKPETDNG